MPFHANRLTAKEKFLALLARAIDDNSFVKLTLSRPVTADPTLKNVFARPVLLRAGPRLSFVYRYTTRDVTRNATHKEAVARIEVMLGQEFLGAHLFTTTRSAQLDLQDKTKTKAKAKAKVKAKAEGRLVLGKARHQTAAPTRHDRAKPRVISLQGAPWLHALGVTTAAGAVTKGMEPKFRQIHNFIELLQPLLAALPPQARAKALRIVDMGSGKGYLTFATYAYLLQSRGTPPIIRGIEKRPELVALCNRVARDNGFDGLSFEPGDIASSSLRDIVDLDVLMALHACDTATDDAIAHGVQAGAGLILVAPCCHKELRPRLQPPPALAGALKHGILLQRHSELVTDALRAALLEWAGYHTRVFEFISTEHTTKNLMIAATKRKHPTDRAGLERRAQQARELAALHGIHDQRLAAQLGCSLR